MAATRSRSDIVRMTNHGKLYVFNFSVAGIGRFPTDMLRYDGCHPYSELDSARIDDIRERRTIELTATSNRPDWEPTVARWSSFCWVVVKVRP